MSTYIRQTPLYDVLPVGQQIVFTVENTFQTQNRFNVKYLAEVHVSDLPINLSVADNLVATFKTTPNNAGVGIFDFQPLLESYVSSTNKGLYRSSYKDILYTEQTPHPIHVIDHYARHVNGIKYFAIQFKVESADTPTSPVVIRTATGNTVNSIQYTFFNGVLQQENYLTLGRISAGSGALIAGDNYGFDLDANLFYAGSSTANSKFLTNAPTTQYANIDDYGTVAFLNFLPNATDRVELLTFTYYNSAGVDLGSQDMYQSWTQGGQSGYPQSGVAYVKYLFAGIFPGNLRNWSSTFRALVTAGTIQGGYYTVQAETVGGTSQQIYTIHVNCPNAKEYESIRLTWLNQWGAWDYYTFTMKSVRSTSTNRTTYTQMKGTWNDSTYRIDGYKGGKKNFRVNSTERISVNTDFVTEADAVWFEELINSQDVYILNGFDSTESAPYNTITNKYVEPVLVTTSSYVRKTIANDKLMQYTFELERNKTQKTHTS